MNCLHKGFTFTFLHEVEILLPVIRRGMFPHWRKAPHQTLTPEVKKKPLAQKCPLSLHPSPGSTCRFPLLIRYCLKRSRKSKRNLNIEDTKYLPNTGALTRPKNLIKTASVTFLVLIFFPRLVPAPFLVPNSF